MTSELSERKISSTKWSNDHDKLSATIRFLLLTTKNSHFDISYEIDNSCNSKIPFTLANIL